MRITVRQFGLLALVLLIGLAWLPAGAESSASGAAAGEAHCLQMTMGADAPCNGTAAQDCNMPCPGCASLAAIAPTSWSRRLFIASESPLGDPLFDPRHGAPPPLRPPRS